MQFYESVGLVVSQVLGGKKTNAPPPPPVGAPAQNADDLAARLGRVLG